MQNPKGLVIKKFMQQVIGDQVFPYDDLLTRLGSVLITDNDIKIFGEMINEVLATGYRKAVEDYKAQLSKLGIEVNMLKHRN